jgi:hypothetical protein
MATFITAYGEHAVVEIGGERLYPDRRYCISTSNIPLSVCLVSRRSEVDG